MAKFTKKETLAPDPSHIFSPPLEAEPRASHVLGKYFIIHLYSQSTLCLDF